MDVVLEEEEYNQVISDLEEQGDYHGNDATNSYHKALDLIDEINEGMYNLFYWDDEGEIMYGKNDFRVNSLVQKIEEPSADNKDYGLALRVFHDMGYIDRDKYECNPDRWKLDSENPKRNLQEFAKLQKVIEDNKESLKQKLEVLPSKK